MMPQKYSNIENESRDPQVCGEMFRLASRDPTVALTLADALHGDSYDSVLADRAAWLEPEKYGHWWIVWRCFWVFQGLLAKKQQAEVGLELLFDDFSGGVSVLFGKTDGRSVENSMSIRKRTISVAKQIRMGM